MPVAGSESAQDPSAEFGTVWVIPIEGTIDPGLAEFVLRVLRDAASEDASLILLEVNTFGGRVDAATEIRDAIVSSPVTTAAFVSERAISAGALVTLAAEQILMKPGATFGAAEPRPLDEKTLSYVRAEFEATAESRGRDPLIAAAMVDASVSIDGLTQADQILTLTASAALSHGFADHIASSRTEALELLGFAGVKVVETQPNWAERIVRFLTDPTVAQILLILGILGLIAELSSPGWGVGGTVGLVCLALFFGSRLIVGILGVEAILLFLAGIIFIVLELFVIPGFGIAGIFGLAAMGASLFMSFPDPRSALQAMAITVVAVVVLVLIFLKRFQRAALWGRLILTQQQAEEYRPTDLDTSSLLGMTGVVRTQLRPAGRVEIEGEFYDAVAEGRMVPPGTTVRVVRVEGPRIVVRPIDTE